MNERIKFLRKKLGMTQEEFASKIKLSRNFIAQIESGAKAPSERTISDICREFDVLEDWLRYGKEPMEDDSVEFGEICREIRVKDKKAKQAILDYWELSQADKELFWKFVEKFMK